jgi:hypothetical protein
MQQFVSPKLHLQVIYEFVELEKMPGQVFFFFFEFGSSFSKFILVYFFLH